jgi:GntR family transcriptional regulator
MRSTPLYLRIKEAVSTSIGRGEYRPNERLPTEDELIRAYGVSRITVRRALDLLQQEGLIERFAGRGTYVASRPPGGGWTASSISDVLELGAKTVPAGLTWGRVRNVEAAKRLNVTNLKVYRLQAVRAHLGDPVYFIEAYVGAAIGAQLSRNDLANVMLITAVEDKLGITAMAGLEEITAGIADEKLAREMRIEVGSPLLILDLTYFDTEGKPIEFARAYYRADRFRRRNVLSRASGASWRPIVIAGSAEPSGLPRSVRRGVKSVGGGA